MNRTVALVTALAAGMTSAAGVTQTAGSQAPATASATAPATTHAPVALQVVPAKIAVITPYLAQPGTQFYVEGFQAAAKAKGWDVNVMGRTDVPSDMPWQTALHAAAQAGDLAAARVLLGLGADPGARDYRFSGTPLSWARHFSQDELIALLEPVTPPGEAA